jgi:uncharacterized membrane protein
MTDPTSSYPPAAPSAGGYGAPATVPGRTLGIVALIVAIFFNIIGLILGIIALVQSRRAGAKNGFALAAIIVGAVLFILGIVVTIVAINIGVNAVNSLCDGQTGIVQLTNGGTIDCH